MKVIQILIEIAEAKYRFYREKSRVSCLGPGGTRQGNLTPAKTGTALSQK